MVEGFGFGLVVVFVGRFHLVDFSTSFIGYFHVRGLILVAFSFLGFAFVLGA